MRILHLEDNTYDAELARALFTSHWPDCTIETVTNRPDFVSRLAEPYDVILSDYTMAGFSGLEALRFAREISPHIPFIFLSGTIGEERALDALRAGATDYVIKDRPKRLIPAMERALNDSKLQRERQQAAEQLLRVQRLENIGMLAAGIAHDFNNVLAPVLMGVSIFRERLTDEHDQQLLTSIESSAMRGAGLVRQILGFARGVTGGLQVIQPRDTLQELLAMLRQTFPKTIRIEDGVEDNLWPINANSTQMHQILLNLCVNARDAMPKGGTLTLLGFNCELDELRAVTDGCKPGRYVVFEVADTGTGIPPEVQKRIWEPFFTTKRVGMGTGLGLSTVRGIVEGHNGHIFLNTCPGRGTTFRILLPAETEAEAKSPADTAKAVPRGKGELILVADDDASVRAVTSEMLALHGYKVLTAANGTEALACIASRILEVRLVITDLDMPNLDGASLSKVVGSLNPAIRVLLVSGSLGIDESHRILPPFAAFLAKPFNGETLLRTVHGLIDSKANETGSK